MTNSFKCYLTHFAIAQTQTVRLKEVPLTEEVEGEKKKFKFDLGIPPNILE